MAKVSDARRSGNGASGEQPTAPPAQDVRRALAVLHAFLCSLVDRELHAKGREDDADPLLDQTRSPLGRRAHCEACRAGKIEGARRVGKKWLCRRSALDAYIQANGRAPRVEDAPASGVRELEASEADIAAELRRAGLFLNAPLGDR